MGKTVDLGVLFGVTFKREVMVPVPDKQEGSMIPALQDHNFDPDAVRLLYAWDTNALNKKNLMLLGPTGSGKSSLIEQYAARMNREVFRVGCHGKMEFSDLLGQQKLTPDGLGGVVTSYQDGPLIMAMRRGSILLLDEANFLHPSVVGGLNGVLDGAPLLNPDTGEVRTSHRESAIGVTLSTRVLVTWGRMIEKFAGGDTGEELMEKIKKTLGYALLNRANADDRHVVEGLLVRLWSGSSTVA